MWHGICIDPPVGAAGGCTASPVQDNNPPAYLHVNERIPSLKGLGRTVETFAQWKSMLRPGTTKHFVFISDDNGGGPAALLLEAARSAGGSDPRPAPDQRRVPRRRWRAHADRPRELRGRLRQGGAGRVLRRSDHTHRGAGLPADLRVDPGRRGRHDADPVRLRERARPAEVAPAPGRLHPRYWPPRGGAVSLKRSSALR